MEFRQHGKPLPGTFWVVRSDEWWVFDGEIFRRMTVEEQIEASK